MILTNKNRCNKFSSMVNEAIKTISNIFKKNFSPTPQAEINKQSKIKRTKNNKDKKFLHAKTSKG